MDAERIYVPLQTKTIIALERESGTTIWTQEVAASWPLVAANGALFVVSGIEIHALDPLTGDSRWRTALSGPPMAPVAFDGQTLVVPIEPASVAAIDAAKGTILWTRTLPTSSKLPAAIDREAAYLSLTDGQVIALSIGSGMPLWTRKLPGALAAPAAARDRVLVGSTDNFFYALESDNGNIEWKWRTGGDVVGSSADDQGVYYAALDNIVRRVNRGNGNQRWKRVLETRPTFPPRVLDGTVVVTGVSPALSEFDARTGAPTGTYDAPGEPAGDLQGPPLLDPLPRPFRVAAVVILRDGRAAGLRPVSMLFREAPPSLLLTLPGRPLPRERLP